RLMFYLHCRFQLKELRRELAQVVAPIDPRMAAFTLPRDRREAMLLEKLNRALAGGEQEIVFADADPQQPQPFFQIGIVELGLMLLAPRLSGGGDLRRSVRRRRAAPCRSLARQDIEQARTEDADVTELLQIRQRDVERLIAAHSEAPNPAVPPPPQHALL